MSKAREIIPIAILKGFHIISIPKWMVVISSNPTKEHSMPLMILLKFGYRDNRSKKGTIAIKIRKDGIKTNMVANNPPSTPR